MPRLTLAALGLALLLGSGCARTAQEFAQPTAEVQKQLIQAKDQAAVAAKHAEQQALTGAQHAEQSVEMATCPVLGTKMPKDKMIKYVYKGTTYYFCCQPCVDAFKKDPEKYIKALPKAAPPPKK